MKKRNEKTFNKKKNEIMEISYDCYAEHGLAGTGIKTVMDACGMSKASIYTYFDSIDDLILRSTAHFMIETELAYMRLAPKKIEDVDKFIDETPYWASKKYGKKYRLMYQIYTHPKYVDYGKKFFDGVNNRYTEYSETLEKNLGIPKDELLPLIFYICKCNNSLLSIWGWFLFKSSITASENGNGTIKWKIFEKIILKN